LSPSLTSHLALEHILLHQPAVVVWVVLTLVSVGAEFCS
jgi:hypothetical protein